MSGTVVVETRVRVPTGDAVQRVYSVADAGGLTVVEVENESTLPFAYAFSGRDGVLTDRAVAALPIEGIELPTSAFVLPVGHRATVHVAIAHDPSRVARLPAGLPQMFAQVVSGWRLLTSTASRLELPAADHGETLADTVTSALRSRPRRVPISGGRSRRVSRSPSVSCSVSATCPASAGTAKSSPISPKNTVATFAPTAGWSCDVALDAARRVFAAAGERPHGRRRRAHRQHA